MQECACETPVAVDRTAREIEHLGDAFQREAGEVVQLDDARGALIGAFELLQRRFERERLLGAVDAQRASLPVIVTRCQSPPARWRKRSRARSLSK